LTILQLLLPLSELLTTRCHYMACCVMRCVRSTKFTYAKLG